MVRGRRSMAEATISRETSGEETVDFVNRRETPKRKRLTRSGLRDNSPTADEPMGKRSVKQESRESTPSVDEPLGKMSIKLENGDSSGFFEDSSVSENNDTVNSSTFDSTFGSSYGLSQFEEDEPECEYERTRRKNIEERMKLYRELGLGEAKKELVEITREGEVTKKPTTRGYREKPTPSIPLPPRKSLRLQQKDPAGVPLPEVPQQLHIPLEEDKPRKPPGPLSMTAAYKKQDKIELCDKFLSSFKPYLHESGKEKLTGDLISFKKQMEKLSIDEEHVAKVVPDRIFSLAVHPSETKLIVAAGGKWGSVGVWDVRAKDEEYNGVSVFEPHSRPVNYMSFCTYNPAVLYSTSYDGTVRAADFEAGVFNEIYATPEDMFRQWTCWHCQLSPNTLLVAQGDGLVALVDQRTPGTDAEQMLRCYDRSVRCVSVHPLQKEYFATSSALGFVNIWDLRKMSSKKSTAVGSMPHIKSMSSALFSPVTGQYLLTTCMDDKLYVYDTSDLSQPKPKPVTTIRHYNHTGRWLTTFKATWHPHREDVFVVGSMERPRRIELFDKSGVLFHALKGECLASVCSICHFHPTLPIVVGGNSSGRVHIFE